jgi:hypothetical protein
VWVSFNHGRRWQRLANELPLVPITDLCVAGNELIAATQGRAFWSFDGLPHLRQLRADLAQKALFVFTPVPVAQYPGSADEVDGLGRNPATDLHVRFYVGGDPEQALTEPVTVDVEDFDGKVVFTRSTVVEVEPDGADGEHAAGADEADEDEEDAPGEGDDDDDEPLAVARGMNDVAITWREDRAKILDGMILWAGRGGAARPAPGDYKITVTFGDERPTVVGRIEPDPRTDATITELQERYRLVRDGNALVTEAHEAIDKARSLRDQMAAVVARMDDGDAKKQLDDLRERAAKLFTDVEETLYQTKSKSRQDPLNFPIKLTDKLLGVLSAVNRAEYGPTDAQREVTAHLSEAIRLQLARFAGSREQLVAEFNGLARELAAPHVK